MRLGRGARLVGYTLMGLAGVASMVWPAPSVQQATAPTAGALAYVWAGLLIVGGLTSAAGAASDRWIGEYAGLWPLIAVFLVYGLAAFASDRGVVAAAAGFALLALAALQLARWHDVALIRREADRQAQREP